MEKKEKYIFYDSHKKNCKIYNEFYHKWYGFFDKEMPYRILQNARQEEIQRKRYQKFLNNIRKNKKTFQN